MQMRYSHNRENKTQERTSYVDSRILEEKQFCHHVSYIPDVIIKPAKMIHTSLKLKILVFVLGLIVYFYLLLFFKTLYMRSKKLEHIMELAIETEKELIKLHDMDSELGKKMETLDQMLNGN